MEKMNFIDMHCDTLWKLLDLGGKGDLMENHCHISIPGMQKAGTLAQFFACYTCYEDYMGDGGYERCYQHVNQMIDYLEEQITHYPDALALAGSYEEIMRNARKGKISALLTVEEGGILNGRMERLEELYGRGVRLMTLLWNYENCLGAPNSTDPKIMGKGLTPFGIEVVKQMSALGMIVDVSHASDGTFWDILRYADGPVLASHSNCRALCPHPRNLSDEMIRALAERGGIAGLNFYGKFLGTAEDSKVSEMTAHVLHMIQVGGSEFPAIGTDFDGIDGMEHMDITDVSKMEKLWDALKKAGIPESQLDKIQRENALRIIKSL